MTSEKLQKHDFQLFGRENEEGDFLNLKTMTIYADLEVLKSIADFLNNCVKGIEEYGESWEHEHLQDQWPQWDKIFPDIEVYQKKRSR